MKRGLALAGVGLGLGLLLLAGEEAAASLPPSVPPKPKPPGPGKPPPGPIPPGIAVPEAPTMERDGLFFDAVRQCWHRPITWHALDCSRDGHQGVVYVSSDALMLPLHRGVPMKLDPDAPEYFRINVRHTTQQLIADALGACLVTSRVADLAFQAADVILRAHTQNPDAQMANTSRMVKHHDAVEAERAGQGGLVRTVGKDWILSAKLRHGYAVNYGWHDPAAPHKGPAGLSVWQPVGDAHTVDHTDYSQIVTLMRATMHVDGKEVHVADVLADPALHVLLSDEGPLEARHPDIPTEAQRAPC